LSLPLDFLFVSLRYRGLFFFCCISFGVYTVLASGWSSNSNYALLGAVRGVAQTISYEVSLALIFISLIFLVSSFNLVYISGAQIYILFMCLAFFLFLCWLSSILAETNRTPFDFAEGESELVSGFNIEYGRGGFALLFLAEYGRIIFIRILLVYLFIGGLGGVVLKGVLGTFFCY